LIGNNPVTASVALSNTAPRVQRMVFYLDGAYLLTDYQSTYRFTLPTWKWVDGDHTLSVEALMSTGFVTQRASLMVDFKNGVSSPPINPRQFTPATGTTPPPGTPFTVVAGGDGASGETYAVKVSNLIASLNPNMFIYLGDVYEKGSPAEFYNWYGSPTTNFGRFRSITNPTVGNHEYQGGTASGYFDYWDNIPNYYSYNAGGWHFISLNSNGASVLTNPTSAQYKWLQQDLIANSGVCTMVYYHHPLYNIGAEGSTPAMTEIWKLMALYGVDIVLNGHDHDYQRWVPLDALGVPSAFGITEFVAGGAGHGLQAFVKTDSRVAYSNDANPTAFGVLLFQLNADGAHFSYHNTDGVVLDSGVIPCRPGVPDTKAPSVPSGLKATAASATKVNLSWTASTDNTGVLGYTIYRNGAVLKTVPASSLVYSDLTTLPLTTYRYAVQAYDKAGNRSALSAVAVMNTPAMPTTLIFLPVADTYVNAATPASIYGVATSMRVVSTPSLRSYLRFTVTGLGGKAISRARLMVFTSSGATQGIRAWAVANNTWSELTTNFSNAPTLGRQLAASAAASAGTWITLDVTGYVTGAGSFNLGLTTPGTVLVNLASRESGANSPRLILDLH
jgi:chitodextrinase